MRNAFLALSALMLMGSCTLGRGLKRSPPQTVESRIRSKISLSRQALERGDITLSGEINDRANMKLIQNRKTFSPDEYEKIHIEIAFLRLKCTRAAGGKMPAVESDMFPLIYNSRVEKWKRYYTTRGRGHFSRYLKRAAVYMDEVKEILAHEGLPEDLAYVAIIESGYYPFARSSAGAVGVWQFMENTAKSKGLKINYWIDERRDPWKSTRAAASYLRDLYGEFGSWEMALAAYNYGPTAVRRSIRRWNTDDYWQIYLPTETEEFIPKIMAAVFIAKEPRLFGFEASGSNPRSYKKYTLEGAVDLRGIASMSGSDITRIQKLNPELRRMATPPEGYEIRIPADGYEKFVEKFESLPEKKAYLSEEEINRRIKRVRYHSVSRGESLWAISQRYNVRISDIKRWNNLSTSRIYPRQRLKLYIRGG